MNRSIVVLALFAALAAAGTPSQASAAGFYVGEQDAVAQARGLAVTAKLDAPSTIFYNPAGMAFLSGLQLQLGAVVILPYFNYSDPAGIRPSEAADRAPIIAPHLYATYSFGDKGAIGIGFNAPYGLKLQWPIGFVGEGQTSGIDLKAPTLYLGGAYRPVPRLAFGATLRVVPGSVELMQIFRTASDAGVLDYAYGHLAASALGVGASFGIMARPVDRLHLGFSYSSRVKLDFSNGLVHFGFNNPPADRSVFHDQGGSTSLWLPDTFAFGVAYDILDGEKHKLSAEFDFDYTLWSSFDQLLITFDSDPTKTLTKPQPKHWKDVPTYRLGLEYGYSDFLALRAAVMYDVTPAPDSTLGPELPDATRLVLAFGAGYRYVPMRLRVDLAYTLTLFQSRTVTAADGNPFPAHYDTTAHLLTLTIGYGGPMK
jgi:long-chain fatty acid transport protein